MLISQHVIITGIVALLVIYPLCKNWWYTIVFWLSGFLFDFDHYIWILFSTNNWNILDAYHACFNSSVYKLFPYWVKETCSKHLMIAHTIEFIITIGLFGFLFRIFFYVALGLFFHLCVDNIPVLLIDHQLIQERYFFLINFIRECL